MQICIFVGCNVPITLLVPSYIRTEPRSSEIVISPINPVNRNAEMAAFNRLHITVLPTFNSYFHGVSFYLQTTCLLFLSGSVPRLFSSFSSILPSRHTINHESPELPKESSSLQRSSWLDKWINSRKSRRPKKPRAIFDYRCRVLLSGDDEYEGPTIRRGCEMAEIVAKLKNSKAPRRGEKKKKANRMIEKGSVEDILCCDDGIVPNKFGGFSVGLPFGEILIGGKRVEESVVMEKPILAKSEAERLKKLGWKMKRINVRDGGVTGAIVDSIHKSWMSSEIVRVKVSGTFATNMKRMHGILERKTGGFVVWRSGTSVVLFRGLNFGVPQSEKKIENLSITLSTTTPFNLSSNSSDNMSVITRKSLNGNEKHDENSFDSVDEIVGEGSSGVFYQNEIDRVLDSLGPRYADWPGDGPLPVDADLLPKTIPNYQPPFRLFPFGVKHTVENGVSSRLNRMAKSFTPHFAIGRVRMHQGLATAMVKLWEVCSIAKISLKRTVMPYMGKQMVKDIKVLTGGVLLFRNKQYLVFYRGNNFLSRDVSEELLERERLAKSLLDEEEKGRLRELTWAYVNSHERGGFGTAGTPGETLDVNALCVKRPDDEHDKKIIDEVEEHRLAHELGYLKQALSWVEWKLYKARRSLFVAGGFQKAVKKRKNTEVITNEERTILRMLGLKMKPVLFVDRRGIFSDTLKNVYRNWKYRDVVKVFAHAHDIDHANCIASSLVAESGGVLVSVEIFLTNYAIIIYRGRDYTQPYVIRSWNISTKRRALESPIGPQRCQALQNHVFYLEKSVEKMRLEIKKLGRDPDKQDELYCGDDDTTDDEEGEEWKGDHYLSDGDEYGDEYGDEDEEFF